MLHERIDEVRSDESGTAGDQHPCHDDYPRSLTSGYATSGAISNTTSPPRCSRSNPATTSERGRPSWSAIWSTVRSPSIKVTVALEIVEFDPVARPCLHRCDRLGPPREAASPDRSPGLEERRRRDERGGVLGIQDAMLRDPDPIQEQCLDVRCQKAPDGVGGGLHDRFPTHVEGRVENHRDAGSLGEVAKDAGEAIGLRAVDGLDATGAVDVADGGNGVTPRR